ncbi:MAG: hypothetical protein H6925_05435 [Holosporaceae bacterium]|nr:MAG: hypothetical protein H6925_05435 [Holosporaceae bacterium]
MCQRFVDKKKVHFPLSCKRYFRCGFDVFPKNWLAAERGKNKPKGMFLVPDEAANLEKVLWVAEDTKDMWIGARLAESLPVQYTYALQSETDFLSFSLAWGMACYRFDRYKTEASSKTFPRLFCAVRVSQRTRCPDFSHFLSARPY